MMGLSNAALAIIAGISPVAIVSVIVGRQSKAPAAIQATGQLLSNVVAAAVNTVSTAASNGNLGANTFTNPAGALNGAGVRCGVAPQTPPHPRRDPIRRLRLRQLAGRGGGPRHRDQSLALAGLS